MADEKEDDQKSEKTGDGGETGDKKTTEKGDETDYKKIAEDQRKRAEIAEGELKKAKATKSEDETSKKGEDKSNNAQADPDELRLIARGLSDDEISEAKDIAKGKGISLMEALKTPVFKAFQNDLKEQEKKEKAKLNASKGSGSGDSDKNEFEPDITKPLSEQEDAHKKAWKKSMGM